MLTSDSYGISQGASKLTRTHTIIKKKKKKKKLKRSSRALVNRCFFCNEEEETFDHILVHYSKARILWDMMLALVRVVNIFRTPFTRG